MLRGLLLLLLLLPGLASALPWWVEDDDDAEQLAALLDALWPGHPIEVQVGEPDYEQPGISFDGERLTWVDDERVRFRASDGDLATQIALVRSWLREATVDDGGWVPANETERKPGPYVELMVGGGVRLPTTIASGESFVLGPASPSAQVSLGGGFASRHVRLGLRSSWSFGERAGLGSQAVNLQRLFAGATVGVSGEVGPASLQASLGGGARLAFIRADESDAKPVTRALPSLFVSVQGWGPIGERLDFGGGLSIGFDTASIAVRVGEGALPLLLSPVTVVGELGARFGCPCPKTNRKKFEGP